jgi:hypothetical protein
MRLPRFITLAAVTGAAASLLFAAPALAVGPAASPAAHAAVVRAELRAEISAQLRYNPSGKVINARQISYDHGSVIVTVPMPGSVGPDFTCPGQTLCAFTGVNLTGLVAQFAGNGVWDNWKSMINTLASLHNNRSNRAFIYQNKGSGGNTCYQGGAKAEEIGSPFNGYTWFYLAKSNDTC